MAGALEAVNGQKVDTQLDGSLGVSDGSAFVQDYYVGSLELLDDRARAVSSRLDNLDALLNDDTCVCAIVWRDHGREKGQVDAKGVAGHGAASLNLFAEVFGRGLSEGGQLWAVVRRVYAAKGRGRLLFQDHQRY